MPALPWGGWRGGLGAERRWRSTRKGAANVRVHKGRRRRVGGAALYCVKSELGYRAYISLTVILAPAPLVTLVVEPLSLPVKLPHGLSPVTSAVVMVPLESV